MNLLIIDDDEAIRQGMILLVKQAFPQEIKIYEADNGLSALRLLYQVHFQLVFVDVQMPVMNGLRLIESASSRFSHTSFIVISAYGEFEYAQKALRLGADDYLLKPVDVEDLTSILERYIVMESPPPQSSIFELTETPYHKRIDVLESWRLFITKGMHIKPFVENLVEKYQQQSFYVCTVDIHSRSLAWEKELKANLSASVEGFVNPPIYVENTPEIIVINKEDVQAWLERLNLLFAAKGISYAVGIGRESAKIHNISVTYFEAKEALQYRLLRPGTVFYYEESSDASFLLEAPTESLLRTLIKEPIQLSNQLRKLINEIAQFHYRSPGSFFATMDRFCMMFIAQMNKEHFQLSEFDALLEESRNCRSIEELSDGLVDYITSLSDMQHPTSANYYQGLIYEAKEYMSSHMSEALTLEGVAESVRISAGHFSRLFRKMTGFTFTSHLTTLRLEKGKELLETGQYRIYEVADKVGYSSWQHFSRLFKNKYGKTPNEYIGKNK